MVIVIYRYIYHYHGDIYGKQENDHNYFRRGQKVA